MSRVLRVVVTACLLLAALPVARASNLDGNWNFIFNTEEGEKQASAVLNVDGEQVSGRFANRADVKGTLSGEKLELDFHFVYHEAQLEGEMKMTGKVGDGKIAGSWAYAGHAGAFQATRTQ